MKKTSLILNVILLAAVAVLYVLHFTQNGSSASTVEKSSTFYSGPVGPASTVYVNLDSLLSNLDAYFDMRDDLMAKQKESQITLDNRTKAFENSYRSLDEKMQKGLITRSNAAKEQESLQMEQQNIMQLREELTYRLAEEEQVMNRRIMNDIVEYIKEYNKDKNFQYVINTVFGGTLLYGSDSLNITGQIIEGMNAKYEKENSKK